MKVHITSTPGYSKESIDQVASLLNKEKGVLEFYAGEPLTVDQMSINNERLKDLDSESSLSFVELFNIGKLYRIIKGIPQEDFVVVLSEFQNSSGWFSAFNYGNIFVDVNGWEYLTEKDSKYGIAYEVIENIFQTLIGIDLSNILKEPNIHHKSRGCINDMCSNKMEVIHKLRSAYICDSCFKRATDKNVSPLVLVQIQSLIEIIRNGLMNFDIIKEKVNPEPTVVSSNGDVKIGNRNIKLDFLSKTLFIFFLSHLEGVPVAGIDTKTNRENLQDIYHLVRLGAVKTPINNLLLPIDGGSTLPKVRVGTNRALIDQLDRFLSEYYLIKHVKHEKDYLYKIHLPRNYLTLNINI